MEISGNDKDQRLDRFLKKYFVRAPLSHIYRLIRKDIRLNGKKARPETMLTEGDVLDVFISEEEASRLHEKKKIYDTGRQFSVIYEDDDILAVSKPFGLLTHGDHKEKKNTLTNQVAAYLAARGEYAPDREKTFSPSPVNRLDRNTTGLVLFGKNADALKTLNRLIRERDHIGKYYLTIASGEMKNDMILRGRMEKDEDRNRVRLTDSGGRDVETYVKPLKISGGYTLAEVRLITGRSHQIRAHLAGAGFPLIGDPKYGSRKANAEIKKRLGISTQLLHAYKLEIRGLNNIGSMGDLSVTDRPLVIEADPPEEFIRIAGELNLWHRINTTAARGR